ncbi:hypothetical protein ACFL3V_07225 [Nanoarchaeota archaeon]
MAEKLIAGIILAAMGVVFLFAYRQIAKGAAKFYKKLYTEKNLTIMFRAAGILLIIAGIIIALKG